MPKEREDSSTEPHVASLWELVLAAATPEKSATGVGHVPSLRTAGHSQIRFDTSPGPCEQSTDVPPKVCMHVQHLQQRG